MSFCGNCGTKLTEGQDFCPGCGAKVRGGTSTVSQTGQEPITPSANVPLADTPVSPTSVNRTDSDASLQKLATLRAQTPPSAKKSGSKVLVTILLFILLAGAAVIGGGVYLAYRVKQKATAVMDKLETGGSANHKASSDDSKPNDSGNNNSSDNNSSKNTGGDATSRLAGMMDKSKDVSKAAGDRWSNGQVAFSETSAPRTQRFRPDLVRNIPNSAIDQPSDLSRRLPID